MKFREARLLHGHFPPPDRSFRHFIIAVAMRRMVFPPNEPLCHLSCPKGHFRTPDNSYSGSDSGRSLGPTEGHVKSPGGCFGLLYSHLKLLAGQFGPPYGHLGLL